MKYYPGYNEDYPPENALEFIEWFNAKLKAMPYELRQHATIRLESVEVYEEMGVSIELGMDVRAMGVEDHVKITRKELSNKAAIEMLQELIEYIQNDR